MLQMAAATGVSQGGQGVGRTGSIGEDARKSGSCKEDWDPSNARTCVRVGLGLKN